MAEDRIDSSWLSRMSTFGYDHEFAPKTLHFYTFSNVCRPYQPQNRDTVEISVNEMSVTISV